MGHPGAVGQGFFVIYLRARYTDNATTASAHSVPSGEGAVGDMTSGAYAPDVAVGHASQGADEAFASGSGPPD